jgi:hypothetical protein
VVRMGQVGRGIHSEKHTVCFQVTKRAPAEARALGWITFLGWLRARTAE